MIFTLRINMLVPKDRALDFLNVLCGSLAPIYWGAVLCTFVVPFAFSLIALKGKTVPKAVNFVSIVGIFLITLLINQMPVIAQGINNRIFM